MSRFSQCMSLVTLLPAQRSILSKFRVTKPHNNAIPKFYANSFYYMFAPGQRCMNSEAATNEAKSALLPDDHDYTDIQKRMKEMHTVPNMRKEDGSVPHTVWNDWYKEDYIPWASKKVHPDLEKFYDRWIGEKQNLRIFVPMCGKSVDMKWLLEKGHRVVGVDLSELGTRQFFDENQIQITKEETLGELTLLSGLENRLKIYIGDVFSLSKEVEPEPMEAVWDRGGLTSLTSEEWANYANHLKNLMAPESRLLIQVYHYGDGLFPPPPQSFEDEDIRQIFGDDFTFELLQTRPSHLPIFKMFSVDNCVEKMHLISKRK